MNFFTSHGKRWDSTDDETLRQLYDTDEKQVLDIAKHFRRTVGAIVGRLKTLKMVRGDIRPEEYSSYVRGYDSYLANEPYRDLEKNISKVKAKPERVLVSKASQAPDNEIQEIRNDIRELKISIASLITMVTNLTTELV